MTKAMLGIIGGSGVYDLPGVSDVRELSVASPWGEPSDRLRIGRIGGREVVFLARHGRGHRLSPSGINYRANIDSMKRAGVTDLVSLSAVGSFREELPPGLFVLPDQYVDRTVQRNISFFGNGCVAHVSMAHPVGPRLQERIAGVAAQEAIPLRRGGTLVVIEGPQFSSFAESTAYRAQGFDLIGMTAMPEAKLAREAEITYVTVAMVTDFDCWHPDHDAVDVQSVIRVMHDNTQKAMRLVARLAADFPEQREPCPAGSHTALDHAIMTAPSARDPILMNKLDAVMARVNALS
ncbi:MAG: S-methyl-5'-thioadenosine phosphorylase [Beijerinckiaceae bacterium]